MDKFKGFKFDKKIYVAAAVVLVIIICIAAYFISGINKNDEQDKKANVSLVGTNLKQDVTVEQPTVDTNRVAATVDIEFSDCAVVVGTQFKVVASVSPAEAAETLKWTSSNEAVFIVDKTGVVTVNGVGTAVLTANIGDVSDAVVIEGIQNIAAGSANNFPVYTDGVLTGNAGSTGNSNGSGSIGNTGGSGNGGSGNGGTGNAGNSGGSGNGDSGSAGNSGGSDNGDSGSAGNSDGSGNGGSGSAGNSDGSGNGGTGNAGNSGGSGNGGTGNAGNSGGSGNGGSGNAGNSGGSGNGGSGSAGNTGGSNNGGQSGADSGSEGVRSDSIGSYLPGLGFNKYMSNIYTYKEGDESCGQIVVLPNVTIIYIMNRSDSFDKKINEVLSLTLTDNSGLVWNNYTTANTDRTFTAGDRTVRIVVAGSGGHSQIVIYN